MYDKDAAIVVRALVDVSGATESDVRRPDASDWTSAIARQQNMTQMNIRRCHCYTPAIHSMAVLCLFVQGHKSWQWCNRSVWNFAGWHSYLPHMSSFLLVVMFLWVSKCGFKKGFGWTVSRLSDTFKLVKINAHCLRGKCCTWKELFKNVWHGAVALKCVPIRLNMLHFWQF